MSSSSNLAPPKFSLVTNHDETMLTNAFESPTSMMESVNLSNTSSLINPPISPTSTYQPTPEQTQVPPSPDWDYDNYIEKPRDRGHVAQPRFLNPSSNRQSQEPSFTGYTVDQMESGERVPFGTESYNSIGRSPTLLAILAYFFGWWGGLVVLILEKKNLFVLFHAWQSLACGIIAFVVQMLFIWTRTLYIMLWIVYLLFNVFMILRVIKDASATPPRLLKVPAVGDWCEQRALNKIQLYTSNSNYYRL